MRSTGLPSSEEILAAHFVGGRVTSQTDEPGHAMDVVDPSTGRTITQVAVTDDQEIDAAIAAATVAQPAWASRGVAERVSALRELVDELARRREEFAALDSLDSGNPIRACRSDVDDVVRYFDHWSAMARTMRLNRYGWDGADVHYDAPLPYGVVLRIAAYNKPLYFAVCGALMPLLTGNAVVIKPAPQSPLSALAFGCLASTLLPKGLVAVLPGDGRTGASLVAHPAIRRIAFTGSVGTGLAIQRACADSGRVKDLTMELGGKNAIVVLADADLEAAAAAVVQGASLLTTQGQSCQATSRVLVDECVHDDLLDLVSARLARLHIGIAYRDDTQMGPLVSAEHRDRVRGAVDGAIATGARVRFDGGGIDLPSDGFFQVPVLLDQVRASTPAAQEEIFGPVLCATSFRDVDEAVTIANGVRYGLTASVWTQDVDRALSVASRLESGYVWVNDVSRHYVGAPFGGVKDSGVGREESEGALSSFVQQRVVHVKVRDPETS